MLLNKSITYAAHRTVAYSTSYVFRACLVLTRIPVWLCPIETMPSSPLQAGQGTVQSDNTSQTKGTFVVKRAQAWFRTPSESTLASLALEFSSSSLVVMKNFSLCFIFFTMLNNYC